MTGDAFEIIKRMDMRTAETQLILRCAPFLAGLKTSNLLIVGKDQADRAGKLLEHTKFHCFFLYEGRTKAVLLLYSDSLPEDFFTGRMSGRFCIGRAIRIALCRRCWRYLPNGTGRICGTGYGFHMKWDCFWDIRRKM